MVRPDDDHLRVTVGLITGADDHMVEVAERLAAAAAGLPARGRATIASVVSMGADVSGEVVLGCDDLEEAIELFTSDLGFRLDMITPADDPRLAVLSGHGRRIRLERRSARSVGVQEIPDVELTRAVSNDAGGVGRAGMHYRDLLPSRRGGRVIASHITIPDAGPVPDYVHHHDVRLQFIYCLRGWVRVVYEDQGPPFVLQAGDCVVQPPGIRHQVLESSAGLEVLEVTGPAEHPTFVDHELVVADGDGRRGAPVRRAAVRPSPRRSGRVGPVASRRFRGVRHGDRRCDVGGRRRADRAPASPAARRRHCYATTTSCCCGSSSPGR